VVARRAAAPRRLGRSVEANPDCVVTTALYACADCNSEGSRMGSYTGPTRHWRLRFVAAGLVALAGSAQASGDPATGWSAGVFVGRGVTNDLRNLPYDTFSGTLDYVD